VRRCWAIKRFPLAQVPGLALVAALRTDDLDLGNIKVASTVPRTIPNKLC